MNRIVLLLTILPVLSYAQVKNSGELLDLMYKKYAGKSCRSFTFSQDNKHYKNDTLSGTSTWYEALEYPDKFRIDFGDPKDGNAVIFRNDSAWHFRKGELKRKEADKNDLLLL